MARAGRKPKPPHLKVVEGNPGKRPIRHGVTVAAAPPDEPDWRQSFQVTHGPRADDNKRARHVAREEWRRVVPVLAGAGILTRIDQAVLADYCVAVARLDQAERTISREGMTVLGQRGTQKHPALTAANQYRTAIKFYIGELGLSPSSRGRIDIPEAPLGETPGFDLVD